MWVGEVGTGKDCLAAAVPGAERDSGSPGNGSLGHWFGNFLSLARQTDADWYWWHMDDIMRRGTVPQWNTLQIAERDRTSYGLFAQEWQGPSSRALLRQLRSIMPATLDPGAQAGTAQRPQAVLPRQAG